MQPNSVK